MAALGANLVAASGSPTFAATDFAGLVCHGTAESGLVFVTVRLDARGEVDSGEARLFVEPTDRSTGHGGPIAPELAVIVPLKDDAIGEVAALEVRAPGRDDYGPSWTVAASVNGTPLSAPTFVDDAFGYRALIKVVDLDRSTWASGSATVTVRLFAPGSENLSDSTFHLQPVRNWNAAIHKAKAAARAARVAGWSLGDAGPGSCEGDLAVNPPPEGARP
jgi:hypothetical protein